MSRASRAAVALIELYRCRVPTRLRPQCRFQPTCSEYGLAAYGRYDFATATRKTIWRILRCNPLNHGPRHDPP
ncbi:MAG TPA: membrane protein insertion efficiency factor YidD [Gaiellaceae bacterium]|nr:membrane protein insertion efficiency factor YidD [Gaiellaceae bacterium]